MAVAGACAGPRPVQFEPLPEGEAAALRSPHDARGSTLCQACHLRGAARPALRAEPVPLCKGCHDLPHGNHPVEVTQARPSAGLPLWKGTVTCLSCHDPHAIKTSRGVRKPGSALCTSCHPRQG
jgi:predicted CXXCH cytochrome family protein